MDGLEKIISWNRKKVFGRKLFGAGKIVLCGIVLGALAREVPDREDEHVEERGWADYNYDGRLDYWSETGRIYYGRKDGFFDGSDGKKYFVYERIVEPARMHEIVPEFIALRVEKNFEIK